MINRAIIGEGTEVYGEVHNSVIGEGVTIEKGAVVRDSIIMKGTVIGAGTYVEKAIIAENVSIGDGCRIGVGEERPNNWKPNIYNEGLVTIGEDSVIPAGVTVGKNTVIYGKTDATEYPNGVLESGQSLVKAGDEQ